MVSSFILHVGARGIPFNGADQFMYPGAYEVRFFDEIVDTSSTSIHPSFGNARMNFEVWDVTPGRIPTKEEVTIIEEGDNPDSLWSLGDRAIIMDGDPLGGKWEFSFFLPDSGDTIAASAGDIFFMTLIGHLQQVIRWSIQH